MSELSDVKDTGRQVLASRRVHRGRVMDLVADEVLLAPDDGAPVVREYLDHPGAVAVVALRGEPGREEVLLLNQYRHPARVVLWEIPAGLLDVDGEDPLPAARRELGEEADLRAATWDVLVDFFTSPGGSDESVRVYLARDVSDVEDHERHERTDEERDMELVWVPLDEAVAAVHAGRIHNPATVVGILATASARAQDWAPLRGVDAAWLR
ncbi:NUDIX domain-containing protein [Georgenia alba]|uniref:NUDIX domain-containing protein n=1 Tax=Georgenia alba TaxID=2233858 RepID=A0ABW2QBX2_9MICO